MSPTQFIDAFDRGDNSIAFGDNVRIRISPSTEAAGIAGRSGQVMGETTPSDTGVTVIGTPNRDYAICVCLKNPDEDHWLDPDLLEFVDHGAGTTISLQGDPTTWTRTAAGEWRASRGSLFSRIKKFLRRSN